MSLETISDYEQLSIVEPGRFDVWHNLSVLYAQTKDYPKAFSAIERALVLAPDRPELHNQLGLLQKRQGQLTEAERSFQTALQLNPTLATTYHRLGLLYQTSYRYAEAERAYEHALQYAPDFSAALHNLALTYAIQNKNEAALASWMALIQADVKDVRAHFQIGKLLLTLKTPEEANVYFATAATYGEQEVSVLESIISVLLDYRLYALAKPYLEKIIELYPEHARSYYTLGVVQEKSRQMDSAMNAYRRAIQLDPDYFEAWNNLGVLYLEQELTNRAKECFAQAQRLQPENESIRYTLGALSEKSGITQSPQAYIQKLFDHYAEHFDVHLTEGLQYRVPELLKIAVKPFLPVSSQGRLLDLGCGTGLSAEVFRAETQYRVGVDLSSKMLEKAATKNLYDVLIHQDILAYLRQTSEVFDLIVAGDVLVYQGALEEWIANIARHLTSGGLFIFSVELTAEAPFHLQKSGRFSHAPAYLSALAKQFGFEECFSNSAVTRLQNHKPVVGGICVWRMRHT